MTGCLVGSHIAMEQTVQLFNQERLCQLQRCIYDVDVLSTFCSIVSIATRVMITLRIQSYSLM